MPVYLHFPAIQSAHERPRPASRYLLSRPEAATYLGVSISSLAHWPSTGRGPRQRLIGRDCYYHIQDLDDWLDSRPCHRKGA